VRTYKRTLSDEEKLQLKRSLPWFGKHRQARLNEIEQGVADVYEFEINRIWDINGCRPPCCPYTLLFETMDDLFVYIESWDEIERQETLKGEHRLIIESTPIVKRLIKSRIEGQSPITHQEHLRELNDFFRMNHEAQWRIFNQVEMPREFTVGD
jgi:hypothetical protein